MRTVLFALAMLASAGSMATEIDAETKAIRQVSLPLKAMAASVGQTEADLATSEKALQTKEEAKHVVKAIGELRKTLLATKVLLTETAFCADNALSARAASVCLSMKAAKLTALQETQTKQFSTLEKEYAALTAAPPAN